MFAVFRPSRKIARGADRLRISAFWLKADCRPAPDQQPTTSQIIQFFLWAWGRSEPRRFDSTDMLARAMKSATTSRGCGCTAGCYHSTITSARIMN